MDTRFPFIFYNRHFQRIFTQTGDVKMLAQLIVLKHCWEPQLCRKEGVNWCKMSFGNSVNYIYQSENRNCIIKRHLNVLVACKAIISSRSYLFYSGLFLTFCYLTSRTMRNNIRLFCFYYYLTGSSGLLTKIKCS